MATANFKSANTATRFQTARPGFIAFGRSWRKRRVTSHRDLTNYESKSSCQKTSPIARSETRRERRRRAHPILFQFLCGKLPGFGEPANSLDWGSDEMTHVTVARGLRIAKSSISKRRFPFQIHNR